MRGRGGEKEQAWTAAVWVFCFVSDLFVLPETGLEERKATIRNWRELAAGVSLIAKE